MNDFSQYYSYCPMCSDKVELFGNYCSVCGLLYLGEGGCPVCDSKIEELPTYSTPTNAELRDKLNEIIRRLK